jgi:SAM-dependent methyltransferase
MTLRELIEMVADSSVTGPAVRAAICDNAFCAHDLAAGATPGTLARGGDRRLSLVSLDRSHEPVPERHRSAVRYVSVLDGSITCDTYEQTDGDLGREIVGAGDLTIVDPGTIHRLSARVPHEHSLLLTLELGVSRSQDDAERLPDARTHPADVPDYYWGYDARYQRVYDAGADLWETDSPNESLLTMLVHRPPPPDAKIIDLGCGEGRDSIHLAQRGYDVVGVDVSRAALGMARARSAELGLACRFLERDVVYLRGMAAGRFDLAINMGCLHMLADDELRARHLRRVHDILRVGGELLIAHCRSEWLRGFFSVPDPDAVGAVVPGRVIDRRIRVGDGTATIPLELLPYREATEFELGEELEQAGFSIVSTFSESTFAFGNTAVVLARKVGDDGA